MEKSCDSHFSKKLGLQLNFQWMPLEEPWNFFELGLRQERGQVGSGWGRGSVGGRRVRRILSALIRSRPAGR